MRKKNRKPKMSMWKRYGFLEFGEMNRDTVELSHIAARYEVHHNKNGAISLQVRCRKDSSVWKLCESLGFDWR